MTSSKPQTANIEPSQSIMVIIDTSAWVDFFRRDGDLPTKLAVKGLLDAYEGALCGPVELEFLGGARANELAKIKAWFDIIPYVTNDQKLWRKGAANYALLRSEGYTVPWNDVLIATVAQAKGSAVLAHDKHFPIMAEILKVHLYRPGYNGKFNPDY